MTRITKSLICAALCVLSAGAALAHHNGPAMDSRAQPFNALCPVLGGKVDPKTAPVTVRGRAYGLCCPACGSKLTANPDKYLNKDGVPKNDPGAGKANTAPQHHMR